MRHINSYPTTIRREFEILACTVRESMQDNASDLAAAIAFWAFFGVFPLLIGVFSLAGYFLESELLQTRIQEVVGELLPGSAGIVRDTLKGVIRYRGSMTWVGLVGLLWSAGKGFGAVVRAVNQELDTRSAESFLLSKLRYFVMAFAVTIVILALLGAIVVVEFLLEPAFLARLGLETLEIPHLQGWAVSSILAFLVFALIYKIAPYVRVAWRTVLPGALLATILFELSKAAFLFYLDQIAHFEAIYGSLSSIIVLLLWLYLTSLIVVLGAKHNIVRARHTTNRAVARHHLRQSVQPSAGAPPEQVND